MKKRGFGKFICGLAIGAGLGVLFAPAKGSETRRQLKKKLDEIFDYVSNIKAKDVKNALSKKVKEIQKELKELDAEKVKSIAKEKASAIVKKADELIQLAKEKAQPVVAKAAEDLKSKAVVVLRDTADKIEDGGKKSNNKKKNKQIA